jgi:hypothetical protein
VPKNDESLNSGFNRRRVDLPAHPLYIYRDEWLTEFSLAELHEVRKNGQRDAEMHLGPAFRNPEKLDVESCTRGIGDVQRWKAAAYELSCRGKRVPAWKKGAQFREFEARHNTICEEVIQKMDATFLAGMKISQD